MAQSGYTPVALYYSTTPGAQPTAGNLVDGELALNIADGYLFYKRSGVVVNLAGLSGSSGLSGFSGYSGFSGSTGISGFSGYSGRSGFSGFSGGAGASGFSGYSGVGISGFSGFSGFSGAAGGAAVYPAAGIPLSTGSAWGTSFTNAGNPVTVPYGGIGISAVTAGYVPFGSTANALGTSANFFWDNTNTRLGVGTNVPVSTLHVRGGNSNNLVVDNAGQQFTSFGFYNNGTPKAQGYWDQTNTWFVFGTDVAAPLLLKTNTTERMRISAAGGVSIGTSTDAGAGNLLVNGAYKTANFSIIEQAGVLNFYNGATKIMSLDASGNLTTLANVTAYGTP